jgi:hypothetical protein
MYLDAQARTNLRGDWRAWLVSDRRPHADPARDPARDPHRPISISMSNATFDIGGCFGQLTVVAAIAFSECCVSVLSVDQTCFNHSSIYTCVFFIF